MPWLISAAAFAFVANVAFGMVGRLREGEEAQLSLRLPVIA